MAVTGCRPERECRRHTPRPHRLLALGALSLALWLQCSADSQARNRVAADGDFS